MLSVSINNIEQLLVMASIGNVKLVLDVVYIPINNYWTIV